MQVKDPEGTVTERPDVCRKETENEDATSGNLKQQGGLNNRLKRGRKSASTPRGSKQGNATVSKNVRSPNVASGDNEHNNASVSARRSDGNSVEDQIPEVDLVDETRKKAIQQELKKMKMGR